MHTHIQKHAYTHIQKHAYTHIQKHTYTHTQHTHSLHLSHTHTTTMSQSKMALQVGHKMPAKKNLVISKSPQSRYKPNPKAAKKVTEEQKSVQEFIAGLKGIFVRLDINKDGQISLKELIKALRSNKKVL